MEIEGVDGKKYKWNLRGHLNNPRKGSSLHNKTREILKEIFPLELILEEVFLPGCGSLYADFYLPSRKIMIEVNGEQHYKFNSHFFSSSLDWRKSLGKDRKKSNWCEINDIKLLILAYNEDEDEWRRKITTC